MSLTHLIVTEQGFLPPNWIQGLKPVSILTVPPGAQPQQHRGDAPHPDMVNLVWVLSSVPEWEKLVRHYSTQGPVMVFTKLSTLPEMQKGMEAGARGYIEALAHPVQLRQAAEAVSRGALWIAAPMLDRLLAILSQALPPAHDPAPWLDKLSKREQEVAERVAQGISNREVSEQLHITVRTVKEHLSSIFAKLGIQDRLQLILMARDTRVADRSE